MHAWEQIQETIEFIEDHLSEEISIDSLAKWWRYRRFIISGY